MKKIISFAVATVAVLGLAVGVQAFATTGHDEDKRPPSISDATTSPDGTTTGPTDGTGKDDGDRDGFTEDHAGKPGESK